jgi:diaminohydroxyphosphoribosylaminopyrimidine deaminase/5-amino-6-(5-phosphoribosylamino)uracil reductase
MRDDTRFMRRALELARSAEGLVSPRPPVGAVVVRDGRVVGEGATQPTPGPHAETVALDAAGAAARGATLYVTLEPCSHHSATAPCADSVVAAGVTRVVAACRDPYPLVRGRGFRRLRGAGIDVHTGVLGEQARELVEPFRMWATQDRPFVTLKLAASLDGKVAAPDGTSRWITGEPARRDVHALRARADAIMVGAGTVVADDPALTVRLDGVRRTPRRVVCDSSGRTPPTARIFDGEAPAVVITVAEGRREWDAEIVEVARSEAGVDLWAGLEALARAGVCHVLCEGGPSLAASLLASRLVDRMIVYLAPIVIGGDAPGLFADGVKTLEEAWRMRIVRTERVGADVRIECSRAS